MSTFPTYPNSASWASAFPNPASLGPRQSVCNKCLQYGSVCKAVTTKIKINLSASIEFQPDRNMSQKQMFWMRKHSYLNLLDMCWGYSIAISRGSILEGLCAPTIRIIGSSRRLVLLAIKRPRLKCQMGFPGCPNEIPVEHTQNLGS